MKSPVLVSISVLFAVQGLCTAGPDALPELPARFDRAVVTSLIANIDKPRNAAYLKSGYFMRRDENALPVAQGWELLQTEFAKAKRKTKKWYIFTNVKGFAAFRLPTVDKSQGFSAYMSLFDEAKSAPEVKAEYYVEQGLAEFINSIPYRFQQDDVNGHKMMPSAIIKAWQAHFVVKTWPQGKGSRLAQPDWIDALDIAGIPDGLSSVIEAQLSDKSLNSYELYAVAAYVFVNEKPELAVDLLKKAKPMLPRGADGKLMADEANWFYSELNMALQLAKRMDEAVSVAQERSQVLGTGLPEYVKLLKSRGDNVAIDEIIVALSRPEANGNDIVGVANVLSEAAIDNESGRILDAKSASQLVSLFQGYLVATRRRSPFNEMTARLRLSIIFKSQQEWSRAREILVYEGPVRSPRDKKMFSILQNSRQSIILAHPQ